VCACTYMFIYRDVKLERREFFFIQCSSLYVFRYLYFWRKRKIWKWKKISWITHWQTTKVPRTMAVVDCCRGVCRVIILYSFPNSLRGVWSGELWLRRWSLSLSLSLCVKRLYYYNYYTHVSACVWRLL